jgi:antitoxin component YwqK of YwqJK toxin-antitoxin module
MFRAERKHQYWYDSEQLWSESVYRDGKLEEIKHWHENGQLGSWRFYRNGKLEGKYNHWHKNGQLWY